MNDTNFTIYNAPDGSIFELECDVINPMVDRRKTRDWEFAETIPAGTRYELRVRSDRWKMDDGTYRPFEIREIRRTGKFGTLPVRKLRDDDDDKYDMARVSDAMAHHMRHVMPTGREQLAMGHFSAEQILGGMIDRGMITIDQVRALDRSMNPEHYEDES